MNLKMDVLERIFRKKWKLSTGVIAALIAAFLTFGLVLAYTLGNVDGTWSNAVNYDGGTYITCLSYDNSPSDTTNENFVNYGDDDGNFSCPTNKNVQSGFGFDGTSNVTFNGGDPFLLGRFTHYNRPIYVEDLDYRLRTVDLGIDLDFTDPSLSTNVTYTMQLDETPNSTPCEYPGSTVCPDRVSFPNTVSDQSFWIDGKEYVLQILGFVLGTPEEGCQYDPNSTVAEFVTEENQQNDACLFGRMIVQEPAIQITKDPDTQYVQIGSTATFTITVANVGDVTLYDVEVTDAQAPGCERDKNDIPALAQMDSGDDLQYTCTVSNVQTAFTNVAAVVGYTAPNQGGDTVTDDDDAEVTVGNTADLGLQKTCADFNQDPPYEYTIAVTNYGPGWAEDVQIVDVLQSELEFDHYTTDKAANCVESPAQTITCDLTGDLADGDTWTVQLYVDVRDGTPLGTPIENEANVTSSTGEPEAATHANLWSCSTSTPVTLASFLATQNGNGTHFEWSTATEFSNAGFNIYVETEDGQQKVNGKLIPSNAIYSLTPQYYSYDAVGLNGNTFYIEQIDTAGSKSVHGPFYLGQQSGSELVVDKIDWQAIQEEHAAKEAERNQAVKLLGSETAQAEPSSISLAELQAAGNKFVYLPFAMQQGSSVSFPDYKILVDRDGLYRVTYEDLHDAGLDLRGALTSDVALALNGEAVPAYFSSNIFGPGSYFIFYGKAVDSLYTHTNVYTLTYNASLAARAAVEDGKPEAGAAIPEYYPETVTVDDNNKYAFIAPNGDPWYNEGILAWGESASKDFEIQVDHLAPGAQYANLSLEVWGASEFPVENDHHLLVSMNGGAPIAESYFEGVIGVDVNADVPTNALVDGANTLTLQLPGDTGADWDIVMLDKYSLTYPRQFVARDNLLQFKASGDAFTVSGFTSSDIQVYRIGLDGLVKLTDVTVLGSDGAFSATFRGGEEAEYVVATVEALASPQIKPVRTGADIQNGSADYLIISHPDFIDGLGALVQDKQAQGYVVKVVNVEDIYTLYSNDVIDPYAIKAYIRYAVNNLDVKYVLLVGGDSYDYLDYLGMGSVSFIPSLYAATSEEAPFAPVDPLYADVNNDGVPDVPLGRLPVRDSSELADMIAKTLQYEAKVYGDTAVLAADESFVEDAEAIMGSQLLFRWDVEKAYVENPGGVDAARTQLISRINEGVGLTNFVGHSGPASWTYKGLLKAEDIASLTNFGKPTVVAQWGCWNTYYVDPQYNTLAHKFLLGGQNGAAAVLGSTTITYQSSELALGELLMKYLEEPGTTIGEAMQLAKAELAAKHPEMKDVLLGWTILGDPTLVIQREITTTPGTN